jgi:hypothetical protein
MRESDRLTLRASQEPSTSPVRFELLVGPAGLQNTNNTTLRSPCPLLSLETALFPFLFPFGQNAFNGSIGLCNYLKFRMQSMFSVFTLHKLYPLMMYQLRQATVLSNSFKQSQLERSVFKYKKDHPYASEEEVFKYVIKHDMPGSLPGSPEWHRNQLSDLLTMVETWGLPSFFFTLTADEVTKTRWPEIGHMEKILRQFNREFTWNDAPIECAALLHARLQAFLKEFILCPDGKGLLGTVQHHVIRYEEQGRGSLHAHIILWVLASDVDRVSIEITAAIPADYSETMQEFVPPSDPISKTLLELVVNKMQHTCGTEGCMKGKDFCKYGFPAKPSTDKNASFHASNGR